MTMRQVTASRPAWRLWVVDAALASTAAYVLALSAQLRVTVPFSPVPITGQTLVVLLIGALLGRRRGLMAVGTYLVGGAVGLPLFAGGRLVGPTGGYLLGFVASVWVVSTLMARRSAGLWAGKSKSRVVGVVPALLAGSLVIYALGLPWLALYVGWERVLAQGLLPFAVGDALKLACAVGIVAVRNRLSGGGMAL